jgi:hypothetical protein
MLSRLRRHLTYANVMATLAVFIALGGSSYAAFSISGSNIKNRSIPAKKLKRNSVTGREIRESRLGTVQRARTASRLEGFTARDLRVRCPSDTFPIADVCVERTARAAQSYSSAVITCALVGTPAGPGRRLPTHGELRMALSAVSIAPGGELTSEVYPSSTQPGRLDVIYLTDNVGSVAVIPDVAESAKAFRCVADPIN